MLVGFVSDEYYAAVPDVLLDFESGDGIARARSSASGAVLADLAPGDYRVTLFKPGFSRKRVAMTVQPGRAYQFRLLSTRPCGYAWPKWVVAGGRAALRLNCAATLAVQLWPYWLE